MRYATALEAAGFVLFMLAPLFTCRLSSRMLRNPLTTWRLGSVSFVTFTGLLGFYLTQSETSPPFRDAALDAMFGYGLVQLVARVAYARWGIEHCFQTALGPRQNLSQDPSNADGSFRPGDGVVLRNPLLLGVFLSTPALFWWVVSQYDVPTWIRSPRNTIVEARRVAAVSLALGESPRYPHSLHSLNGNLSLDGSSFRLHCHST